MGVQPETNTSLDPGRIQQRKSLCKCLVPSSSPPTSDRPPGQVLTKHLLSTQHWARCWNNDNSNKVEQVPDQEQVIVQGSHRQL